MSASALLVAGLSFGDEGKGSIVDHLVRKHAAHTVVRYNGAAQAAHNVVLSDGRHHTFSQFGSGTFVPGVRTHLSRHMLVNPRSMWVENQHLIDLGILDAFDRTTVERGALITTPFQIAANRMRENIRSGGRHGSCGMGVGETMSDFLRDPKNAITVGDIANPTVLRNKLKASQDFKRVEFEAHQNFLPAYWETFVDDGLIDACMGWYTEFADSVTIVDETYLPEALRDGTVVFEGAQGVLLDQSYGFHPYTTWTDITFKNAYNLLKGTDCSVRRIGILRAYATRHGAGPFVTEDKTLERPDLHNRWGEWQESFRVGHFDNVAARYAIDVVGGVDEIALTHLDRVDTKIPSCIGYELPSGEVTSRLPVSRPIVDDRQDEALAKRLMASRPLYKVSPTTGAFVRSVETSLKVPIPLCSFGPTAEDKVERLEVDSV